MKTLLYPRLAATNLRKNAKAYLPYLLTCIFTCAMFYIMDSLSRNQGLNNTIGSATVEYTLSLGRNVIAVFAVIFLFYTNSFLTKNRKKEFGLYGILGMEKKHLARVLLWESLYVLAISLALGLLAGVLLDKLMYLAISKLLKTQIALGFYLSRQAMLDTLLLFAGIFLLIFLHSLRLISLSKPIELLRGGNTGEKEPKANWLFAVLGVLCLAGGYYIAVTVKNPLSALTLFFIAVLLVIAGTYLLFTSGSIAFLKLLKKNKRYYYKTNHFISVSGLLYRMKQNAVGLANICILSTMVLVMVSATASLMLGTEEILLRRYPNDLSVCADNASPSEKQAVSELIHETANEQNLVIEREAAYEHLQFMAMYDGKQEFLVKAENDLIQLSDVYNLCFLTAEDYTRCTGTPLSLAENEVALWSGRQPYRHETFRLFGTDYTVKQRVETFIRNGNMASDMVPSYGIVVKDASVLQKLDEKQREVYGEHLSKPEFYCGVDLACEPEEKIAFYQTLNQRLEENAQSWASSCRLECRESRRKGIYQLYGSLFFVGIFLGLLFTVAAVLLIYYKQVSEGYGDQSRFAILQQVGMSKQEVKGSIHAQILIVFFLPLVTAGIHTAFAFPILKKILAVFMLSNQTLFILCTIGTFLLFALIYAAVYALTARVYYKIVRTA